MLQGVAAQVAAYTKLTNFAIDATNAAPTALEMRDMGVIGVSTAGVLAATKAAMATQVRTADIVCRFGGEEFLVLLPGLAPELAMHKAEQLRAEFAALRTQVDGQAIAATLSVGVAAFPRDAKLATELLRVTDQALYRAKHQGRNRVELAAAPTGA